MLLEATKLWGNYLYVYIYRQYIFNTTDKALKASLMETREDLKPQGASDVMPHLGSALPIHPKKESLEVLTG